MKYRPSFLVAFAAFVLSRSASADSPAGPSSAGLATEQTSSYWYGWQTLSGDAAAAASLTAATLSEDQSTASVFGGTSLALYLVVAPAVHLAHGRGKVAAFDLGLRVAAPLVGGGVGVMIGLFAADGVLDVVTRPIVNMVYGVGIGAMAAVALDAVLLAREPRVPSKAQTSWVPTVTRVGDGATVGVTGRF